MARHKDMNWTLPAGTPNQSGGHSHCWESIHAALLMDIRDELKKLNNLLHCQNFIGMPHDLRQLNRRMAQRYKLPKGRTKR